MTKAGGGVAAAGRVLLALLVGALGVVALPRPVTAPAIAAAITPETAFEIDGDIPDDRFVFKAPSGVEVMDMTKMSAPGG